MKQLNKGNQILRISIWLNLFLLWKNENRRCPTITPTHATRPRSLTIECSTETWIVHIGDTGTVDRTAYLKMLPRDSFRRRRSVSLAPSHLTLHGVQWTSSGLRNSNVFYVALLNKIQNLDATTSSRCTCWWRTSTLGSSPTITWVSGRFPPHHNLFLTWLRIGYNPLVASIPKHRQCVELRTHNDTVSNRYIATPLSEHKLLCVNRGSRTDASTQVMIPSTASWLRATRSILMLNGTPRLPAPLTTSAVNWKTWKHTEKIETN